MGLNKPTKSKFNYIQLSSVAYATNISYKFIQFNSKIVNNVKLIKAFKERKQKSMTSSLISLTNHVKTNRSLDQLLNYGIHR
jgi:hypothetical protein